MQPNLQNGEGVLIGTGVLFWQNTVLYSMLINLYFHVKYLDPTLAHIYIFMLNYGIKWDMEMFINKPEKGKVIGVCLMKKFI